MGYRVHPLVAAIAVAFASPVSAQHAAELDEVVISAHKTVPAPASTVLGSTELSGRRATTSDTASMLADVPGVSLYGAGGLSSLPAIHGLADDRLRVKLDGMDLIASCPNHMNPVLSYADPNSVAKVQVYAGISPVGQGGDSIGGSIVVDTAPPEFAAPGQSLIKGEIGAFYRSNNDARGGNVSATAANDRFSIHYAGSSAKANNYMAGGKFKTSADTGRAGHTLALDEVGSSAYETRNHQIGLAFRSDKHLFEAGVGFQDMPHQFYPNQRMDLTENQQTRINLRHLGQFDWGSLDTRVYRENVRHTMNFGDDKQLVYGTAVGMPMKTDGKTLGASIKASIDLSADDLLRVGAEWQQYRLDDWWPAVANSNSMGPQDFNNIKHGKRDRTGIFGEWEGRLNGQWTTLLGTRFERVVSDTAAVHGYGGMMNMNQTVDAARLNTAPRRHSDDNLDVTALARYTADANRDVELGLARKVRSPNLYERYTWSTASMMMIMNNFVGDGNGYVGNAELKPETAYTASASLDLHAADRSWFFNAAPYYTRVSNYIDAIRCPTTGTACTAANATTTNQFVTLQYANQSARLYGLDLSGKMPLGLTALGAFGLKGSLAYVNGRNLETGDSLYNVMPLHARITLIQQRGAWDNGLELVAVRAKNNVSDVRNELQTGGYALVNLRAAYVWQQLRVDFGVENLFDRKYALPTGGAYTGQGATMFANNIAWGIAVPGMGRSLYAAATLKF